VAERVVNPTQRGSVVVGVACNAQDTIRCLASSWRLRGYSDQGRFSKSLDPLPAGGCR
jgi:hypothetical protein